MPWPPGSRPVTKVDQATGLCGGFDVPSVWKLPSRASLEKCGIFPSSMSRRTICGSMPSTPRTNTPARSLRSAEAGAASKQRTIARASRSHRIGYRQAPVRKDARPGRRARLAERRGVERPAHRRLTARRGEEKAPRHLGRRLLAEQAENRRGDVEQVRLLDADRAVAEEDAGHERRIDAVVAAPALRVVGEDLGGDRAGRALPAVPVAPLGADQQIGRAELLRPRDDAVGDLDLADGPPRRRRIDALLELARDLLGEGVVLGALGDDAGRLATFAVDEEAGEPAAEGPRAAPIDRVEPVAGRRLAVLQHEVAVVAQPRVQIDAAPEVGEPVVGDDHDDGVRVARRLEEPSEDAVHALVDPG